MTFISDGVRYWLAVVLSAAFLVAFIVLTATTPFHEAWDGWIIILAFTYVFVSMLVGNRYMLRIAKYICYVAIAYAGVFVIVGIIGCFYYSAEMALLLLGGIVGAFIAAIFLSGVHESESRMRAAEEQ